MDTNTTHRPVTNDRVPSPAAGSSPEEATGDSEVSVDNRTAGHSSPSETDHDADAESCNGGYYIDGAAKDDDESDGTEDDDVGMDEVVDSKMALPWPAAAELGGKLAAGGGHAASETNDRLFWEACIAHGY